LKRRNLLLPAVFITAVIVWYAYYHTCFTFLSLNDAMDYASMGRNVARGDGFVSSYITPLGLANKEGLPHPDLWRAPLWPAVVSLFIKLLGATDQTMAIATGCFFIAGAVLVFLLARELFDDLVAFLSALIFIVSSQNLINSVSGMTETISIFMMVLTVYLIAASRWQNYWGDILAGAALGLFYLTRYNALLFVPFLTVFLWYKRGAARTRGASGLWQNTGSRGLGVWDNIGGRGIGLWNKKAGGGFALWPVVRYLGAFAVVISPWLIRNYILMGSPLFSLQKFEPAMFTATYPAYSMYMTLIKINVVEFLRTHPIEIWAKVVSGWSEFLAGLSNPAATGVSPYLYWLFLISLVLPFQYGSDDEQAGLSQRGVRPLVVVCFLTQLAVLLVIHFIYRLFFIFMPFYIIFGVAALVWLLRAAASRLPVNKRTFVALFAVLVVGMFTAGNLPSWKPAERAEMPFTGLQDSVKAIMNMSTRKDLIISNDGHLLAWYGDRYAAKLPLRVDMIPEMEKLAPLRVIYLSSRISWNLPEADESWRKLFWSKPKEVYGFKQSAVFPDGSVIYRKDR